MRHITLVVIRINVIWDISHCLWL